MKDYPNNKKITTFEFSFQDFIEEHEKDALVTATVKIQQKAILFEEAPIKKNLSQLTLILMKKNSGSDILENYRPIIVPKSGFWHEKKPSKLYMASMQINRRHQLAGHVHVARARMLHYIKTIKETGRGCLISRDVKNAFGSVDLALMAKMINCPNLLDYFKRCYTGTQVKLGGNEFIWKKGLFQGSPLSALYFMIYADYVISEIKDLADDIIAYVDDFVFYFKETPKNMPEIEKIFNSYCLFFNTKGFEFTGDFEEVIDKSYLQLRIFDVYSQFLEYREKLLSTDKSGYKAFLEEHSEFSLLNKLRNKLPGEFNEIMALHHAIYNELIPTPINYFAKMFNDAVFFSDYRKLEFNN